MRQTPRALTLVLAFAAIAAVVALSLRLGPTARAGLWTGLALGYAIHRLRARPGAWQTRGRAVALVAAGSVALAVLVVARGAIALTAPLGQFAVYALLGYLVWRLAWPTPRAG